MKPKNSLRLLAAAGLSLGMLPQAWAAGTLSGTTISNQASVVYDVDGVTQDAVLSTTATFVVDSKLSMTVAEVGSAATLVVPGASAQVTTFTVTNTANTPLDFLLSAVNMSGDDFEVSGFAVYVEDGTTPGYQPLEDVATYIDELAIGSSKTVYVLANIPAGVTNTQYADVSLVATAAQSTDGTGAYVATPGTQASAAVETNVNSTDDTTFIDTVFADTAGTASGDGAADGQHSDDDRYTVQTAALSVTKASTVVTDPFNCTTAGDPSSCGTNLPKAVPGAVVEYCLDVENTGSKVADAIVLTDAIPANTTYVAESIKTAATGTGSACDVGSGTAQTDAAGGDGEKTALPAPRGSVIIRSSSIATGARFKAVFRVTVD